MLASATPQPHDKGVAFLQWRLGHDHGIGADDLASAFDIPKGDALGMLRGELAVPAHIVAASKAAINRWKSAAGAVDIRTLLRRAAAEPLTTES